MWGSRGIVDPQVVLTSVRGHHSSYEYHLNQYPECLVLRILQIMQEKREEDAVKRLSTVRPTSGIDK